MIIRIAQKKKTLTARIVMSMLTPNAASQLQIGLTSLKEEEEEEEMTNG